MPGCETVIFDDSRKQVLGRNAVGEVATRGPHVCLGYFNDPQRTEETFSNEGWLFSGDLGTIDEAGFLHVVGRKKDIINRAGLKISASEVEGLLSEHPAVREVAVVGIPDAKVGEKSCAFIVPTERGMATLDDLILWLKARGVAPYKLPEQLVIVTALPMTPTGKVQKFKLREQWQMGEFAVTSP